VSISILNLILIILYLFIFLFIFEIFCCGLSVRRQTKLRVLSIDHLNIDKKRIYYYVCIDLVSSEINYENIRWGMKRFK